MSYLKGEQQPYYMVERYILRKRKAVRRQPKAFKSGTKQRIQLKCTTFLKKTQGQVGGAYEN